MPYCVAVLLAVLCAVLFNHVFLGGAANGLHMRSLLTWMPERVGTAISPVGWTAEHLPDDRFVVLWLVRAYVPALAAGPETTMHALNRALLQHGWSVVVAAPGQPHGMYDGVHVMDSENETLLSPLLARRPIVATHMGQSAQAPQLAAQHGLHIVELVHNDAGVQLLSDARLDPRRVHFLFTSSWVRQQYGVEEWQTAVVRPSFAAQTAPQGDLRRHMHSPGWHTSRLLSAAPRKPPAGGGLATVLNAHTIRGGRLLLQLATAMPHVNFLGLRGKPGYEGQVDSVAAINLPNVHFSNCTAADVATALAASHTILVPSAAEAHGALALQALAEGLPVIAVDTPALREGLGAGATLFAPASEPEVWAGALSRLREDSLWYERASARALQWSHVQQRKSAVETHLLSEFFLSIVDSGV